MHIIVCCDCLYNILNINVILVVNIFILFLDCWKYSENLTKKEKQTVSSLTQ